MTARKLLVVAALFVVALPLAAGRRRSVRHAEPGNLTANEWLRATAIPFATTEARSGTADLEPLRRIVGDAHIVGDPDTYRWNVAVRSAFDVIIYIEHVTPTAILPF